MSLIREVAGDIVLVPFGSGDHPSVPPSIRLRMNTAPKRHRASYVGWGCLLGALPGIVVAVIMCAPLLSERISAAAHGETGERSDWGEPLVYMAAGAIMYGVPGAGIGALIGAAVGWIERRQQ